MRHAFALDEMFTQLYSLLLPEFCIIQCQCLRYALDELLCECKYVCDSQSLAALPRELTVSMTMPRCV